MTKLRQRGQSYAASLLVPSIVLLALALALLAVALFPASGLAAEEGGEPPVAPELSFPQAPLDLGKVTVGTESTMVNVNIHNAGATVATIEKVTVEGPDAGDYKLSGSNCGWLEPGQDCSASIAFAPGSLGAKEASLIVQPQEFPTQSTPLAGTGVAPQLAFTPGSYDFGIQRVNRSESSTNFQLANVGEAGTQIGSIGIGGKNSNNFWTNGGDCWNGRWLAPGESCSVQIGFNPWDTVAYEAQLQAQANGSTFGASLAGTGGQARVEPGSNPTLFGAVTVGTAGPVQTVLFTNHGNLPGNFFIGIVAGGDAGSFRLLDESCSGAPVAPAGTCVAHVRFAPQDAGPKLARLALFGDDEGGTMAMLSGLGVAPAVTLTPGAYDFDPVAAGARGGAHAFAVRNEGSTALDLSAVAIVGADLDQFAVAGEECSGATLAPGAECLVRVRFAPDSAGAKSARLRIVGPAGAFAAELSGTAGEAVDVSGEPGASDWPGFGPAGGPGESPRPWRYRARHHRFSRGDAVASARGRTLRRADIRARTVPR
ncbi:MAG TPA: choice-of-anchor D domain-containing protein [Solirubrobacterales bacterium]|jgi:hypothetical protein|nr:choice-of-anchor D domain-containing protein [Solirubrobacterales bacterium]